MMKAIRGTFCKSSCMASGKMAAVVASWQVAGPGSHCASSFFFWGAFGVSFDSCWPPQLVLQFFPPPFSKHPPSPWLSNEFSFALLTLGWFVFIVRNKRELHGSIRAGIIPWTEEPGGLQSVGLQSWT